MNFDYSEEQRLLADSIRRFIGKDYDFAARKAIIASAEGYSPAAWETFAGIGLLGLPFSSDYGGGGAPPLHMIRGRGGRGEGVLREPCLFAGGRRRPVRAGAGPPPPRGAGP